MSEAVIEQLNNLGITQENVQQQIDSFKNGIPPVNLIKPATLNDGISAYSVEKAQELVKHYLRFKDSLDILKFVPASGAASRMFKGLFGALELLKQTGELNEIGTNFFENLTEFPFYNSLKNAANKTGVELETLTANKDYQTVLELVLLPKGLNYGYLPKALLDFHKPENEKAILALEEHFKELCDYATSDGIGRIHFTVSPEHSKLFYDACNELSNKYADKVEAKIEFSEQSSSTNTVAVFENNEPVVNKNGELMFRPGGHGALLENLNQLRAQMVFVKNIDNVSAQKWHTDNAHYKQLLAGRLLEMRENIHSLLNGLIHESGRKKASDLIFERWGIKAETEEEINEVLDRPIRVCGMVKNTGAPGGGPFWVQAEDGSRGLQIVESSQVDMNNPEQKAILESATHFNPVDLVCWIEDHSGVKFDLMKYRNDKTGFISEKSFEGKTIKALELPGLWNGAMDGWITEFVEVPLHTFNPVKTVFDLLNEGHVN